MTTTTANRRRELLAAASLLLPAAVIAVSRLALDDRLPGVLASHWSDTGAADATLPTAGALAMGLALAGVPAIAGIVAALVGRGSRLLLGCLGMIAGLGASTWITSVGTTLSAGSAESAPLGLWLLALLGGALFGIVPALLASPTRHSPRIAVDRLPLGGDETGAWSLTITGRVFAIVGGALAAGAVVAALTLGASGEVGPAIGPAAALGVGAILSFCFARVRVTADRRGLRVVSRVLGIPLRRIPLSSIASATTAALRPADWGGWGYRFTPGRSALILGTGPGLVVTTTAGSEFAISLRDPETPAALLEALRVRA